MNDKSIWEVIHVLRLRLHKDNGENLPYNEKHLSGVCGPNFPGKLQTQETGNYESPGLLKCFILRFILGVFRQETYISG